MKKNIKQEPVQPKEETAQVLTYKKDLEEIKDLLKVIIDKMIELKPSGGF